jgi:hypothetical protein
MMKFKTARAKKDHLAHHLERALRPSHITFVQAATSVSQTGTLKAAHRRKPGPMRAG